MKAFVRVKPERSARTRKKAGVIKIPIRSVTYRMGSSDQASEDVCFFLLLGLSTGNALSLEGIGEGDQLLGEAGDDLLGSLG